MQSLPTISSGLAQMLQWITLTPVLLPYLGSVAAIVLASSRRLSRARVRLIWRGPVHNHWSGNPVRCRVGLIGCCRHLGVMLLDRQGPFPEMVVATTVTIA
jgi:hypothetical protein